jgi:hypothetical protein
MLSCPNESSQEWKDILNQANGNREKALELWSKSPFAKDESLNTETDSKNVDDEREGKTDSVEDEKLTDDFSDLVDKIKLFLKRKLAMLEKQRVTKKTEKEAEYRELIKTIDDVTGIESINMFLEDSYVKAVQAERNFSSLLKNIDKLDKKEAMQRLTALNDFAYGYSILDEIADADIVDFFNRPTKGVRKNESITPEEMLDYAIRTREKIKRKYINIGLPLMAGFLSNQLPADNKRALDEINALENQLEKLNTNPKATPKYKESESKRIEERIEKYKSSLLDQDSLTKMLKEASKDTDVIDFLFSPLISSEDSVLALFAKAIKSQLEKGRMDDIRTKEELVPKFEEYADSVSASRDNPAKFNEGLYEVLEFTTKDPETGEDTIIKRAAFVQKFDMNKFKKAQKALYDSVGEKPIVSEMPSKEEIKALKEYNRKVGEWFRDNKVAKPQDVIDKIMSDKEKERDAKIITDEEYNEWLSSVKYTHMNGTVTYKGELSQPSNKYLNPNWEALYDSNDKPKNAKGKYHKYLLDQYLSAQEKIPNYQRPGYLLPSIEKTDIERALTNGVKNLVKTNIEEAGKIKSYDTEFGLADLSESGVKFIPVYYTQPMALEDVSLDLARSVLMFNSMANRYDAINEVYGEIKMFKTIIGEREVPETNSKGQRIIDSFAQKHGYTEFLRKNGEKWSQRHVDAFIDMVVFGEMQKAEEIFGLSAAKLTNTITGFSAITSIAMDVLKGVANNLQGNIQLIIEANSSEFFSKKNLVKGKSTYAKAIPGFLSDFGKSTPESFGGKLVEFYDALQGEFKDQYGKNVSQSMAMKLMRTDTLFFNQHFGEHEIQVSSMFSLMDNTFVTDNNTGEQITLLEAHQKYGTFGVFDNTSYTEKERQAFQNRLHALSKRMHGVYNDFDKATAQRYSLGRLGMMYRKHVVPGYMRRFKNLGYDQELEAHTEGYYRTFWHAFLKDLVTFKWNMIKGWSSYTPFQKAQVSRVLAETTIIMSLFALILVLTAMADDDDEEDMKKNYAYNFILYEAIRMRSETSSYISPIDAYRIFKSPTAAVSTAERLIRFTNQLLFTWDPEKLDYQRREGIWEKGDNKSWAYFLKLIGLTGYNITPEAAVESFKGTIR